MLSQVFRGKFLALTRAAFDRDDRFRPAGVTTAEDLAAWAAALAATPWVVYAKPPFGGPERVLKYLARYTHRVAISNRRLVGLDGDQVTFHYKDYADDHRTKTMTLAGTEFLRRFVQHILPKGFVKVRHSGLLANRRRDERLAVCRRLLLVAAAAAPVPPGEPTALVEPARQPSCPHCGSSRFTFRELGRESATAPGTLPVGDTS